MGQVFCMIGMTRLLIRRVGMVAITSFLWQHRGSVVRTVDLACRLPQAILDGRARDALTEAKAIVALDRKVPTRTDVRISGFEDGSMLLRGDLPLESFEETRATLLAVGDVVDVRTSPVGQHTFDDVVASTR